MSQLLWTGECDGCLRLSSALAEAPPEEPGNPVRLLCPDCLVGRRRPQPLWATLAAAALLMPVGAGLGYLAMLPVVWVLRLVFGG